MSGKLADEYCNSGMVNSHEKTLLNLRAYAGCQAFTPLAVLQEVLPDNNRTLLMSAAKSGCLSLCIEMLQHTTVGINTQNSKGYTALHFASFHGHTHVASLLLNRGADVSIRNHYRETSIEAASTAGFHDSSETLWRENFTPVVNPHSLDMLLTPKVEGLTISQLDPRCNNCVRWTDALYLRERRMLQWLEPVGVASLSHQHKYGDNLTNLLDPFSRPVCPPDLMKLNTSEYHKLYSIATEYALSNCILEVIACDPGCSNVPPSLSFDFNDLLQKSRDESTDASSFTVGRSSRSSICLSDMSISKHHATLTLLEGVGLCVTDMSKHGSAVNGVKLYNHAANVDSFKRIAFLKRTGDKLSVGRVHLEVKKKKKSTDASVSSGFQPNQQLGQQLVNALKQKQTHESRQRKCQVLSQTAQSQRQMQNNIASRILMKRREVELSESENNDEENHYKRMKSEKEAQNYSADFDSAGFIGRSMLTNLGWKEGTALGTSGGEATELIDVSRRNSTSGLGSTTKSVETSRTQGVRQESVWEQAQHRYKKLEPK